MDKENQEILKFIAKTLLEISPVKETDSVEEQFRYYALKIGVVLSDAKNEADAYKQYKLTQVYKECISKVEEIIKGE